MLTDGATENLWESPYEVPFIPEDAVKTVRERYKKEPMSSKLLLLEVLSVAKAVKSIFF
jgi:hypothetical protein